MHILTNFNEIIVVNNARDGWMLIVSAADILWRTGTVLADVWYDQQTDVVPYAVIYVRSTTTRTKWYELQICCFTSCIVLLWELSHLSGQNEEHSFVA